LTASTAAWLVGAFLLVPKLRRRLATAVPPKLNEVIGDLVELARGGRRPEIARCQRNFGVRHCLLGGATS